MTTKRIVNGTILITLFSAAIVTAVAPQALAAKDSLPNLRKLMDTPLRDTSICRGPDGAWYMTGTVEPFWGFNEGIRVWKSADLTNWVPLGFVWKYGGSPWHKPYFDSKKPLWAPEIHFLKGTFWLTYSMPGWKAGDPKGIDAKNSGSGLLRSTSGKAEGPYVDVQPEARIGDEIDASLFQDDDGSVHFLWHSGKIAKMKPDLSGLAEPYHWLRATGSDPDPKHHSGLCAGIFGTGSFDHVGFEGMFIFKRDGRYHLSCADQFDGRYSCMVATATNLLGPYGARYEAIPHGGHNMFFMDERGQWWSSYFGSDGQAPWRERAGILPVEFSAEGRVQPASPKMDAAPPRAITVSIAADQAGRKISPDLFGIFFEDINYAADGGLYAELIQNRSFEYSSADNKKWNPLTAWATSASNSVSVESDSPLHENNPHYAVIHATGADTALRNEGFDGIALKAGEKYDLSLFARTIAGGPGPILARLESRSGTVLAEAGFTGVTKQWSKFAATFEPKESDAVARLTIVASGTGSVGLDMVSLFPQRTFRHRPNGLRADLAQAIADLKPKFIRFPGGCLAHGDGLGNLYRWKNTIGPVEQRKAQPNIWRYHQTAGLGYFEYFELCEDVGATPLPVVAAGVCCQNSNGKRETGQEGLPMGEMPGYVQEVLDLVEWANGPATSTWGAKRAAAGHPQPFNLRYLGVGNEDVISPLFKERFRMIHDAVKAKHPEIEVVGTVGPYPDGRDFEEGWKFANDLGVPLVDEHYYRPPDWFLENLNRSDSYDRTKTKVYVGEYAAHDPSRNNTWRTALAEAAFMTALERNGDVVRLASYAPLLAKLGHTQWRPDMIYFDNTNLLLSATYFVQQLFAQNSGDVHLPATLSPATKDLAVSCVRDSKTGEIILKLVNTAPAPVAAQVRLTGGSVLRASQTVLAGDVQAQNSFGNPRAIAPVTTLMAAQGPYPCDLPASSLIALRFEVK